MALERHRLSAQFQAHPFGFGGVDLEPTTWVLGVVGAALLMLGRLLRQANALQDELERFV